MSTTEHKPDPATPQQQVTVTRAKDGYGDVFIDAIDDMAVILDKDGSLQIRTPSRTVTYASGAWAKVDAEVSR